MNFFSSLLFFALLFFSGCSQKEVVIVDVQPIEQEVKAETLPVVKVDKEAVLRTALVESALEHLDKKSGKDCSGFVELVNFQNDEPYYKSSHLSQYYDNAKRSKAIFNIMRAQERVFDTDTPKIGDLVFFEDTIQKSKRKIGSFNITHVGIVTQIDDDGTIHFIHNIQGKNRIDQLNIQFSHAQAVSGKSVNSYLKRCYSGTPKQKCLTAYYFSAFAKPLFSDGSTLSQN
ncbi:MAG: CHAP domain-containing protein [Sulfurimonas sp.]|uniref:CHAP domain-containing protein n=1 Tax=Sulfurimonas sp. TaxID=2022749 RepID=UPI00262ED552|nr:CHAP domain-containing protein [Sulfurimonas sp.]MDD2652486.1 CHAP domain-containing protein [Sulfurimonas sp.]MDD3452223.1 CHAP domain-containing protein [Sulfurimonas sp.]